MPPMISPEDAKRDFEQLVSAVRARKIGDTEVEQFALLLGKIVLLSTSHPELRDLLDRDDVTDRDFRVGRSTEHRMIEQAGKIPLS